MSHDDHFIVERFSFNAPGNTAVFICPRVRRGAAILYVSHERDGDWQFLCGGEHADATDDPASLACLECTVARDPSLNEVADLCEGFSAERERPGAEWVRHDAHEDFS